MAKHLSEYRPQLDYDGACPCYAGTVNGIEVEGNCWRTGPQPEGISIEIQAEVEQGLETGLELAAATQQGWPGFYPIYLYFLDTTIFIGEPL